MASYKEYVVVGWLVIASGVFALLLGYGVFRVASVVCILGVLEKGYYMVIVKTLVGAALVGVLVTAALGEYLLDLSV